MNRRMRRQLTLVGLTAIVGATAPAWAPKVLRNFGAFRVQGVEVVGTRFVAPEAVRDLVALEPGVSVWDDPERWEERVETHPLIEGCRIGRSGLNRLLIQVDEVEPVALVPTPVLVPVDALGNLLPIDPAEHAMDLPILDRETSSAIPTVSDQDALRTLRALDLLIESHPAFIDLISEIEPLDGRGLELRLIVASRVRTILLPTDDPVKALKRVELALNETSADQVVVTADARFRGQVILKLKEGA
jgi:cell division septal protein FtsQ